MKRRLLSVGLSTLCLIGLLTGCVQQQGKIAVPAPPAATLTTKSTSSTITIGTFNIQNFGLRKATNAAVMSTLANIVSSFDVTAIQEVSDTNGTGPKKLLQKINASGKDFGLLISDYTGREPANKASREAYAFFWNKKKVRPVGAPRLYDDSQNDSFRREPFIGQFEAVSGNFRFVLITIHTDPSLAVEEIGALDNVVEWARGQFPNEDDFIVLGDFNGSCDYATPAKLDALAIRGPHYKWIVPDDADTNLAKARCAYDRIVITEPAISDYTGRWGVSSNFTQTAVSDHWPVWAQFWANRDN